MLCVTGGMIDQGMHISPRFIAVGRLHVRKWQRRGLLPESAFYMQMIIIFIITEKICRLHSKQAAQPWQVAAIKPQQQSTRKIPLTN